MHGGYHARKLIPVFRTNCCINSEWILFRASNPTLTLLSQPFLKAQYFPTFMQFLVLSWFFSCYRLKRCYFILTCPPFVFLCFHDSPVNQFNFIFLYLISTFCTAWDKLTFSQPTRMLNLCKHIITINTKRNSFPNGILLNNTSSFRSCNFD